MARSGKRDTSPAVRPVLKVELSDKNRTLRWILIIGFLCIAVIAFLTGMFSLLNTEPGWEEVESATTELSVSEDFILSYCFGQTDESASTEKKRLTLLFSDATEDAYRIFTDELQLVNRSVNQPVTVDPALYDALELVQRYGSRNLYLAPVYVEYNRIFMSESEAEAAQFDPSRNREQKDYIEELVAYCNDPAMIDLELLGDNQVQLNVADAYLTYAQQNEIDAFLDLNWMTNAFAVDYLADVLTQNGFTNGYLASYDGFTRNLDSRGEQFTQNLFDRQVNSIYMPATFQYNRPVSIVSLRNFPLSERDRYHYYTFANEGVADIVTTFVNPDNGFTWSAVDSLTGYSYDTGCAEIMLQLAPVFISYSLDEDALRDLTAEGIYSLWFGRKVLYHTDPDAWLTIVEDGLNYTTQYFE